MKKKLILTFSILAALVVIIGGIIIYRNYSYCEKQPPISLYDDSILPTPVDPEILKRYPNLPPTVPPDPNKAIKSNPDFIKWMTRCFPRPRLTPATEKPEAEKPEITEKTVSKLKQSEQKKFDIFGEAKFDTSVTGYLKIQEEETLNGKTKLAYLVITDYKDEQFMRSLKAGIERGNGVNKKEKDLYLFNLGCFKDGKIVGSEYTEPYIDKETQESILMSSSNNQVSLNLYFEPLDGRGCSCCHFAHKIRIIKKMGVRFFCNNTPREAAIIKTPYHVEKDIYSSYRGVGYVTVQGKITVQTREGLGGNYQSVEFFADKNSKNDSPESNLFYEIYSKKTVYGSFNIGAMVDGKIKTTAELNTSTEEKILSAASSGKLIALTFYIPFGEHDFGLTELYSDACKIEIAN